MDKRTLKSIDNILDSEGFLSTIAPILLHTPIGRIKKNILSAKLEAIDGTQVVKSMPYKGIINLINTCNLRCNFCEISYFYKKFEKIHSNAVDMDVINKYSPFLRNLYDLELYGSVGEPLLNPHFVDIVKHIKSQYGARLFLNTNGTLIDSKASKIFVNSGFDEILVSLHAGTEETYNKLIGKGFNCVLAGVWYLVTLKEIYDKKKPIIGLAFALNKINAADIEPFVEMATELDVDYIAINHYYDVRNKLGDDISYNSAPENGNALLDWMYELARSKKLTVVPATPPYLPQRPDVAQRCTAPWSTIKFEGCMEYENSHYITVCNRIVLFRLNYNEYDFSKGVNAIWNHPILQYLRGTVSSRSNPLCAFCKNEQTTALRCLDNKEYRRRRDAATQEFFRKAIEQFENPEIKGLYLMERTPYE